MNHRPNAATAPGDRLTALVAGVVALALAAAATGAVADQGLSFADLTFSSHTLTGKGHAGPYLLPHERIAPQSETVIVNLVPLTRDKDYTIDYGVATLNFAKALDPDDQVTVRYAHAKGAKKRKPTPITGDTELYKSDTSRLKLLTGYLEDPKGKTDPLGNYGLDFDSSWVPNLRVSSTFLVSDHVERPGRTTGLFTGRSRTTGEVRGQAAASNTAAQTVATLDAGRSQVTAKFTRVGEDYRGVGKDKKQYKPGTENLEVRATHAVSDNVTARAGFASVEKDRRGRAMSETKTTTGGVNLKLDAKSDVDLSTKRTEANGKPTSQTHQLKSHVQAHERVDVGLTATRAEIEDGKTTDTQKVTSKVRATDKMTVDLAAGRTKVDGETTAQTREVKSSLKPGDKVSVVATYATREQPKKQTETTSVAVQAAAGSKLAVKGTLSRTDSARAASTKSHAADLSYQPLQGIRLTGLVAEQVNPSGSRSAAGGTLSARLRRDLQVSGGYIGRETEGLPFLRDTKEVQVAFTPFEKLSLRAKLADSPAKKLWRPQAVEQRSLRVGSQLTPSVNLSGGFTTQQWYDADRTSDVTDIMLSVDFFRRHSVYAGLTLTDNLAPTSVFRQKLYTLGYAYQLGSQLSLSVDGTLTEHKSGTADSELDDKPEYNIEGKLSAHF